MASTVVLIVSHNSEAHLPQCLDRVVESGDHDVIVVDNASTDASVDRVRATYPEVRVVELDRNGGYGAGNNAGFAATTSDYVLILNPDAWPVGDAINRLVEVADASPWAAIVAPRLLTPQGLVEPSVRGFPTLWRLATEYFFLRWIAPWSRALNAFYGAGVDGSKNASIDWPVGAAMLVRRSAFDEVGGFDTSYFMYDDEVDLCFRLRQAGWQTVFTPFAEFVHVGGGSSEPRRADLHREQLRSHIRFLHKHSGPRAAARGRRLLLRAMRFRSVLLRGDRRTVSVDAARWLAAHDLDELLRSGAGPVWAAGTGSAASDAPASAATSSLQDVPDDRREL